MLKPSFGKKIQFKITGGVQADLAKNLLFNDAADASKGVRVGVID